jgi:hypothetical protein
MAPLSALNFHAGGRGCLELRQKWQFWLCVCIDGCRAIFLMYLCLIQFFLRCAVPVFVLRVACRAVAQNEFILQKLHRNSQNEASLDDFLKAIEFKSGARIKNSMLV